jgi:Tol biopolymer transport system component/tRNA A-37 threonylcarbamoyl transferase component Bud32
MALTSGTRLGPYEILAQLAVGGMGEVYRARDSRLDRDVAIKVLPQHLWTSPESRARFEREAKTISSLNHPNICTLFDVGSLGDTDYLVMELVEGETLASRLGRGALPLPDTLRFGMQIADALDRAHRAGVVHRDLKPGNVMLTRSGAKLMDFGLASRRGVADLAKGSGHDAAPSQSPTEAMPLTAEGTMVGTLMYMSPEQLESKEADARSDIFAFGAVLYEMATGRRAFPGKTQVSIASAILERDPEPIRKSQPNSPAALDLIVGTCLAKDPDDRYASAHDIGLQLGWLAEGALAPETAPGLQAKRIALRYVGWITVALLAIVGVGLGSRIVRRVEGVTGPPALAFVPAPPGTHLLAFGFGAGPVVVSPDATRLAFSAIDRDGTIRLWVRPLDSRTATPVSGTENASAPFWSPDGRSLAFFSDGGLKTVDLMSGRVDVVCDTLPGHSRSRTGAWSAGGTIVFSNASQPLSTVPVPGGKPTPMGSFKPGDTGESDPVFLPDGDHFLFDVTGTHPPRIEMGSLSSGSTRQVLESALDPGYANGFLLFLRDRSLFAQSFDPGSGRVSGSPVALADASPYSAARSVLAIPSSSNESRLQWFDQGGTALGTVGGAAPYLSPRLSPDGRQVLALVVSPSGHDTDVWSIPTGGGVGSRLTFGAGGTWPVWSPDEKYVAYATRQGGRVVLARKPADGSGGEETLIVLDSAVRRAAVTDWSPDGRYLSYDALGASSRFESWILPMFGDRKPFQAAPTRGAQFDGNFSPDGRWFAYFSDESGRFEVFVVPFPGPGGKFQISDGGGWAVRWANTDHLLFLTAGNQLMEAGLTLSASSLHVRSIRPLFQIPLLDTWSPPFDVTAHGRRILAVTPADPEANSIGLLMNWPALATPRPK